MYKLSLLVIGLTAGVVSYCQDPAAQINADNAKRIISVLAADEMKGRKTFSPEIDKAADFIAAEFKAAGLQPAKGAKGFLQPFTMMTAKQTEIKATANGAELDAKNVLVVTAKPALKLTEASKLKTVTIPAGASLFEKAVELAHGSESTLVLVDESFSKNFGRLSFLKRNFFAMKADIVFLLANTAPATWSIDVTHDITMQKLANVVGILPGKSKKEEYVIFSGHYDHIGTGKPANGDSIYNGANDDAAGTTAVIMLAKYFATLKNNERTLVFATFTAEEIGGFGSQYFSEQFKPDAVKAMFNIEMIGTESKWGKNSAYITGFDKTDMGALLQKNLEGTGFTFHPDPYPTQQLFYRSDNATLAKLGVPAHTISTAKMDGEPHYHKLTDHVETLDMENMAMIIRSIALSSRSIVAGKDTPSRVKPEDLKR